MKIKILCRIVDTGTHYASKGEVIDVPEKVAKPLLEAGRAILVATEKPKAVKP